MCNRHSEFRQYSERDENGCYEYTNDYLDALRAAKSIVPVPEPILILGAGVLYFSHEIVSDISSKIRYRKEKKVEG